MQKYIEQFQLQNVLHEPLRENMTISTYQKGELILQQGEQPSYLYFLVEGRLKFFATSDEGKTLILTFSNPFAVIGDIEFIQKAPYLNSVEAVTDVTLLKIPLTIIHQHGMQYIPFMTFILETLTRKFYLNGKAMHFNILYGVEVRVASYILSMTAAEESVSVSHLRDAADLIGTSYRHLNRILAQFNEERIIERDRKKITVINREKLYEIAKHNIYEER